jgi:TPP-dependent 2-oxoacid decarboxylase
MRGRRHARGFGGRERLLGACADFGFPFLDQVDADPEIAWVGNCNEMNAAYAADAYARVRGMGTPTTACRGTSRFPRIYQEMTAALALLTGDNACQEIDRVLLACCGQKRPVHIQFPSDVQILPADPPAARLVLPEPTSDPAQLEAFWDRFVALLNDAQYPVMLVDYPVVRYQLTALIQDVSGKTGIPLAGTVMTTSAFLDKMHPTYLGLYPLSGVAKKVDSADC